MILPAPECDGGFTESQVAEITGEHQPQFWAWMRGQTMMLCDGRRYNHDTAMYEPSCGPHGPVVYRWDLERFLSGLPAFD